MGKRMTTKSSNIILLVGLPYSGKSTFVRNYLDNIDIVDTDSYIEKVAKNSNKTYGEVFYDNIKKATLVMNNKVRTLIANKKSFVVDQTNLTKKSRAKWVEKAHENGYKIIAVVFKPLDDITLKERIRKRKDKVIPIEVLTDMKKRYTIPTYDEGFDEILYP